MINLHKSILQKLTIPGLLCICFFSINSESDSLTLPAKNVSNIYNGNPPTSREMQRGVSTGSSPTKSKRKLLVTSDTTLLDSTSLKTTTPSNTTKHDSLPTVSYKNISKTGKAIIAISTTVVIGGLITYFLFKKDDDDQNATAIPDPPNPPGY